MQFPGRSPSVGYGHAQSPTICARPGRAEYKPEERVKSLRESNVLPFHDILDADMVKSALAEEGVTFNACIYTPLVTLCLFLSQVLDPDHSCRAAVARLIVWLAINRRKTCAPETNTYCDARQRL